MFSVDGLCGIFLLLLLLRRCVCFYVYATGRAVSIKAGVSKGHGSSGVPGCCLIWLVYFYLPMSHQVISHERIFLSAGSISTFSREIGSARGTWTSQGHYRASGLKGSSGYNEAHVT